MNLPKSFQMVTATSPAKTCYIESEDKCLSTIYLPDGTPISVGRSPETNIQDSKCSREQVRLCADYAKRCVAVQQLGLRACGFNGFKTRKDVKLMAQHGDQLEIIYGKYPYRIEFNPPPPKIEKPVSQKRSRETEAPDSLCKDFCNKLPKFEDDSGGDNGTDMNPVIDNRTPYIPSSSCNSDKKTVSSSEAGDWENYDNGQLLIFTAANVEDRQKIAAYDMDGTLIKTKSGLVLPKDCSDWQLLYPDVPGKLKKLHADGYKIVIFTNQAQIGAGRLKVDDFKSKIENVVKKIGVPIQVFIATSKTIYRKPTTGMWRVLESKKNGALVINKATSMYVGDAAGREKNWAAQKRKDHSSADRLFALNLGLKFETPEEHFLGQKPAPYKLPNFNPKSLSENTSICDRPIVLKSTVQEMILMVGGPGSGKSHFVKCLLTSYERVNRDTLGSWQKCIKEIEKFIRLKKSVVVDNTNGDRASRKKYIDVAKKHNVPVRCFVMTTSIEHAKHNNKYRELTDPSHEKISDIIIHSYAKRYEPPSPDEGFTEIARINFVPRFFTFEDRQFYEMYLLDS